VTGTESIRRWRRIAGGIEAVEPLPEHKKAVDGTAPTSPIAAKTVTTTWKPRPLCCSSNAPESRSASSQVKGKRAWGSGAASPDPSHQNATTPRAKKQNRGESRFCAKAGWCHGWPGSESAGRNVDPTEQVGYGQGIQG